MSSAVNQLIHVAVSFWLVSVFLNSAVSELAPVSFFSSARDKTLENEVSVNFNGLFHRLGGFMDLPI